MLKSRTCFPRAAGCKRCLGSMKCAARGHALQSGKPSTHYSRNPCYSLIQDTRWQTEGTRNQFDQAVQNCAFLWRGTFNLVALNCSTLHGSCHSANSGCSALRKYGFLTYWASISHSQNTTAPRRNAHQCLISSKPFPTYPSYYIHSTKPTKSSAFRLLRLWFRIPHGAWISVCCECCLLSRWGLCDELITRASLCVI